MDTSQRGMGLDWPTANELIRRSTAEARTISGAGLACGVGTDQLPAMPGVTLDQVRCAYEEQLGAVEAAGGRVILMASRALVRAARSADNYLEIYGGVIRQTREIAVRRRLPAGVRMFTGDDFNYAELIEGDAQGHSHALLGIFDPIGPAAAAAMQALAADDRERFRAILEPTVLLSRKIFETPTQYYKTGVVFLPWLNGHPDHFVMVGGTQSARSALHYADVFRLADKAGLLRDPDLASVRMGHLMALHGID